VTTQLSIIIPYFNERDYIAATLASLGRQTRRDFCVILVDNASTDGSAPVAEAAMALYPDLECKFLHNPVPGQLPTLDLGLSAVTTPFVASCDADTIYPDHYVETCMALFEAGNATIPTAGVMAIDLYAPAENPHSLQRIAKIMRKSRMFRSQCHAGGYAHAYRTDLLRTAGGFQSPGWPYLLYDHEVYQRVRKHGAMRYSPDHYCFPSDRRTDRASVSWNWLERTVYRFTPGIGKDWFFYQFLAKRFARRGLVQVKLRERAF
jgi:glycosyltransferase involved in cell wall biosynthesis